MSRGDLGGLQLGRPGRDARACTACACLRSRASIIAISRIARSRPRASGNSSSACWAPRPCSAGRSGGPPIIAIITCIPTSPRTCIRPVQHGFFWSHMGWFMSHKHFAADLSRVKDLLKYPELRFSGSLRHRRTDAARRGRVLARRAAQARRARLAHLGLADARVGLLHLHGRGVSRHLHHQLAVARLRPPALQDRRQQPQQRVARASSPSARAGTTTTTTIPPRRVRGSIGGSSTSRSTC